MIRPFSYYKSKQLVKKTEINPALERALLQKAEIRLKRISKGSITEEESSVIFEDIYEAVREALQSLMQRKRYKPYSHEALISFVKEEKLFSEAVINDADRYRILRNRSVYEAVKVSSAICKEALLFAQKLLKEVKKR
jgi:hypothetical protein